jgi:rhodanese-related sulfurtransferase
LAAAGVPGIILVEGGTTAWVAAGLPVERGQKGMSLERQVRITAGALVFTGVVLGSMVSPYWFALSGVMGAGLMFAGITDTCAMGMVMAKMPWNQVKLDKPAQQYQVKPKTC